MNQLAPQRLTVEEFIAWSQAQQSGRYELEDGRIIQMAPERLGHIKVKFLVAMALTQSTQNAATPVFVLTDGAIVRIGPKTAYECDALVYAGPELPDSAIEIANPIIVVEVLSPSSGPCDSMQKLENYFTVDSIQHYLIVDPDERLVLHHRRSTGSSFIAQVISEGELTLDPPGLTLDIAHLFSAHT
jgi:Uma2 family endonuclease